MNFCVTKFWITSIKEVILNIFTKFIVSIQIDHISDSCLIFGGRIILIKIKHVPQSLKVPNNNNMESLILCRLIIISLLT
jgi:hypothetical protein